MRKPASEPPGRIALACGLLAGLWVFLLSSLFGFLGAGPHALAWAGPPADLALSALTAVVVCILLRRELLARRAAEQHLFNILTTTAEAIVVVDEDYRILLFNQGAVQTFGYSVEEVLGQPIDRLLPERFVETHRQRMQANASSEGKLRAMGERSEVTGRRKDGTEFPAEASVLKLTQGKQALFTVALYEITKRKQIETAHQALLDAAAESRKAQEEHARLLREIDGQRLLFQTVVQNAPVGIARVDGADLRLRWANPAIRRFLDAESRSAAISGRTLPEILAGTEHAGLVDIFRRVADTGQMFDAPEFEHVGFARGVTYWRWSLVPVRVQGIDEFDLIVLAVDITEQVEARKRVEDLAARADRQLSELSAIFAAITDVVLVWDTSCRVLKANAGAISLFGVDPTGLDCGTVIDRLSLRLADGAPAHPDRFPLIRCLQGETVTEERLLCSDPEGRDLAVLASMTPLRASGGLAGAVMVLRDVTTSERLLGQLQRNAGQLEEANQSLGAQAQELARQMAEAAARNEDLGRLSAQIETERASLEIRVRQRTAELKRSEVSLRRAAETEAAQARALVEANELLEQRVTERTRELEALQDISRGVAAILELQPLLGFILEQLKTVVDYSGAAIMVPNEDHIVILEYRGPVPEAQVRGFRSPLESAPLYGEVARLGVPVIIPDLEGDTAFACSFRQMAGEQVKRTLGASRSLVGVPLMVKERMIGMLRLDGRAPDSFTPHHVALALALASQAAVAIENARLYESAQYAAALEERQRLARDLHDSVSQALYGIVLGTHAAIKMLESSPGTVEETLRFVLTQAEAAVTEMRALIFELHPETLAREGLSGALAKQVAAVQARHRLVVNATIEAEPELPLGSKEDLYRVAQEALSNAARHARASQINLVLRCCSQWVTLEVSDDGIGFNPEDRPPDHLGLQSMHERVWRHGGRLEIESQPGHGTLIRARIPLDAR